jgi:hypothetical protein
MPLISTKQTIHLSPQLIEHKKTPLHIMLEIQDWLAQTSIKFKSQLNLKCKLISCIIQVSLMSV